MSISGQRFGLNSVFFQDFTKKYVFQTALGKRKTVLKCKTEVSFVPFRTLSLISFFKVLPVPVN